jgi:hypothetical protein
MLEPAMDALPLAPRANLEQYRKLAKKLLRAWKSEEGGALRTWARRWLESLTERHRAALTPEVLARVENEAGRVEVRVRERRAEPPFTKHVESLKRKTAEVRFEAAADAVMSGDVPRALLEKAFISACAHGRTRAAELLLERGVDIGASDGQTGPHMATHAGHIGTVRYLLSRKAPLEARNQYGGTVLDHALWSAVHDPVVDYVPIIEALLALGAMATRPGRRGSRRSLRFSLVRQGASSSLKKIPTAASRNSIVRRHARRAVLSGQEGRLRRLSVVGEGPVDLLQPLPESHRVAHPGLGRESSLLQGRNHLVLDVPACCLECAALRLKFGKEV